MQLQYLYPAISPTKVWLWLPLRPSSDLGPIGPDASYLLTANAAGVFVTAALDHCLGPPPLTQVRFFENYSAVDAVVSSDDEARRIAEGAGPTLEGIGRSEGAVTVTFTADASEYTPEACVRVVFTPSEFQPEAGRPRLWDHGAYYCRRPPVRTGGRSASMGLSLRRCPAGTVPAASAAATASRTATSDCPMETEMPSSRPPGGRSPPPTVCPR